MYRGIFLLSLRGCVYSVVFTLLCLRCWIYAVGFVLLGLFCWVFVLLGLFCWVCAVGFVLLGLCCWVCAVGFVLLSLCCCICAVGFVLLYLCCCICAVGFVLLGLCCWVFVLLGLLCCVQNFVRPPLTLLSFPLWLSYLCWSLCYGLILDIFTSWSFIMSNFSHKLYHLFPDFPWFWIYFLLFSSLCPFFSSWALSFPPTWLFFGHFRFLKLHYVQYLP